MAHHGRFKQVIDPREWAVRQVEGLSNRELELSIGNIADAIEDLMDVLECERRMKSETPIPFEDAIASLENS